MSRERRTAGLKLKSISVRVILNYNLKISSLKESRLETFHRIKSLSQLFCLLSFFIDAIGAVCDFDLIKYLSANIESVC